MFSNYFKYGSEYTPLKAPKQIKIGLKSFEEILHFNIKKLSNNNPIYTLSGGIDSSLIFSFLEKPDCFCVQVDGNEDYEYAKKLDPNVLKIEFNNVDIEKILTEIQTLWDRPHCMLSDMYDYYVYTQFPKRIIIVGEEPRYVDGIDWTPVYRKIFFYFRYDKIDSPYLYNSHIYNKNLVIELAKKRLPEFITKRVKRKYSGPNPTFLENHKDQIQYLKIKYNVVENQFDIIWRKINLAIWKKIHNS